MAQEQRSDDDKVMEATQNEKSVMGGNSEYKVESPDENVTVEVIPTPPLVTEENLRFSLRNVQSKLERVDVGVKTGGSRVGGPKLCV